MSYKFLCKHGGSKILLIAIVASVVSVVGCGYAAIGSSAYELTVALDQAVERKDVAQIKLAAELIDQRLDAGELTEREAKYLNDVVELAEQGEWERARQTTLRILEDQVDW